MARITTYWKNKTSKQFCKIERLEGEYHLHFRGKGSSVRIYKTQVRAIKFLENSGFERLYKQPVLDRKSYLDQVNKRTLENGGQWIGKILPYLNEKKVASYLGLSNQQFKGWLKGNQPNVADLHARYLEFRKLIRGH